jgi:hypothetical protein
MDAARVRVGAGLAKLERLREVVLGVEQLDLDA